MNWKRGRWAALFLGCALGFCVTGWFVTRLPAAIGADLTAGAYGKVLHPKGVESGKTTTVRKTTENKMLSPALDAFRKTDTAAKRKVAYAKTWTDPSTVLRYSDKSSLTVKMVKNPSNLEGAINITTNRRMQYADLRTDSP